MYGTSLFSLFHSFPLPAVPFYSPSIPVMKHWLVWSVETSSILISTSANDPARYRSFSSFWLWLQLYSLHNKRVISDTKFHAKGKQLFIKQK
jgi:hypothetical protein